MLNVPSMRAISSCLPIVPTLGTPTYRWPSAIRVLRSRRLARSPHAAQPRLNETESSLLMMQALAGNAATVELFAPSAQRTTKATNLDEAIQSGDSSELDPFRPFPGITTSQLLFVVNMIVTEGLVSWREESILEKAWTSIGEAQALATTSFSLWKSCENRGASLNNVKWLKALRDAFVPDVEALTRDHLSTNEQLVNDEMARLGLPQQEGAPTAPPSADQAEEMRAMQEAAKVVGDAQEQQELARGIYVGYRVEYPPPEGKEAWVPVTFDPFNPPTRADAPPQPDPNDPKPDEGSHAGPQSRADEAVQGSAPAVRRDDLDHRFPVPNGVVRVHLTSTVAVPVSQPLFVARRWLASRLAWAMGRGGIARPQLEPLTIDALVALRALALEAAESHDDGSTVPGFRGPDE